MPLGCIVHHNGEDGCPRTGRACCMPQLVTRRGKGNLIHPPRTAILELPGRGTVSTKEFNSAHFGGRELERDRCRIMIGQWCAVPGGIGDGLPGDHSALWRLSTRLAGARFSAGAGPSASNGLSSGTVYHNRHNARDSSRTGNRFPFPGCLGVLTDRFRLVCTLGIAYQVFPRLLVRN